MWAWFLLEVIFPDRRLEISDRPHRGLRRHLPNCCRDYCYLPASRDRSCARASARLRFGLSDQSHFSRVFRPIVGETPYAWRRMWWGEIEHRASGPAKTPTTRVAVLSSGAGSDF